ncbi:hypothetical protein [Microbacterium sp. RU1D]|uniref:hypothetical protein n=2 Tax=unclassified Microbacterium TaxID=2609290 RepID=UPI00115FDD5C|nr:hypothetical protein [Microbacterium sp. RU1D]
MPGDAAAARAFTARLRAEGSLPAANTAAAVVAYVFAFGLIGGAGVFLIVLLTIFGSVIGEGAVILGLIFSIPILLGLGALVAALFAVRHGQRKQEDRRWRLAGFARDVGMEYVPALPEPALPGAIFQIGGDRTAYDLVRSSHPRFVEVGNHSYTVSNGKNTTTSRWGYIAVRLDVPLPHIVLDAMGNGVRLGLWERGQHLSLEGDFDRYFRLYCPAGYERDALYLFTPDVMARFVDTATPLEVEIIDDWLFLYSPTELSTLDPARWAWLFSVIAALLEKLEQWGRWRDDRLPRAVEPSAPAASGKFAGNATPAPVASALPSPDAVAAALAPAPVGVAPPGRRLRRSRAWIIALLAVAGVMVAVVAVFLVGILFFLAR